MKKIIASITILCYFAVTFGVIVNFHYCMDRLASTELFATESEVCGLCGMEIHESGGCCRDEVKIIKIKVDQKAPLAVTYHVTAPDAIAVEPSAFITALLSGREINRHHHNHSPPLLTGQDTYLRNCVFRI